MKPLRLISNIICGTTLLIAMSACGEKSEKKETPSLKVSSTSLTFNDNGGTENVSVTANVDWTAKSSDAWLTVTPASGTASQTAQTISVKAEGNNGLDRTGTVTVAGVGGPSASITVTQTAYIPTNVEEISIKTASGMTDPYKYQKYRLSGTVRYLAGDGSFNLVDDQGSIPVAGLNASDAGYGYKGGALDNVKERCKVTIVGYLESVDGKMTVVYAYLEKADAYTEPDPATAETKSFPYTVDYKATEGGVIVNNPVFPAAFEAIWTHSGSFGWQASGYKNGTNYTTESWLYTEKVDLKGAEKPILVFEHIVNNFDDIEKAKDQTTVWISVDGGEFTKLSVSFSYPDELGDGSMTSENVNLSDYIGSTVQFAFKYVSDEKNEAGTWSLLKVQVIKDEEPEQPDNSGGTEDYDKPGWDWNN